MRFWKESTLASASALILAAAGFFTVSAVGCGGDDNGSQDTTDPEDVVAPEDTEPRQRSAST